MATHGKRIHATRNRNWQAVRLEKRLKKQSSANEKFQQVLMLFSKVSTLESTW